MARSITFTVPFLPPRPHTDNSLDRSGLENGTERPTDQLSACSQHGALFGTQQAQRLAPNQLFSRSFWQPAVKSCAKSLLQAIQRMYSNPKGRMAIDIIAVGVLLGLLAGVAAHGGVFAIVFLAVVPTLCVGTWIAYRLPQKINVEDLGPLLTASRSSSDVTQKVKQD